MLQLMDPGVGRRWVSVDQFQTEIYQHAMPVDADGWRDFAASDEFQAALLDRLRRIGISGAPAAGLTRAALAGGGWHGLAALDASVRLISSLVSAGGVNAGSDARAVDPPLSRYARFNPQALLVRSANR